MYKLVEQIFLFSKKAEPYLLLAIAFTMPIYSKITTLCIIAWAFCRIVSFRKQEFIETFKQTQVFVYPVLFFISVVSLCYTLDLENGWSKVQTQISFLVFPVLLGGKSLSFSNRAKLFNTFVLGTCLAVVFCLCYGLFRYIEIKSWYLMDVFERKQHILFYSNFSEVLDLHPTYFSLYIGLCLFYLILSSKEHLKGLAKYRAFLISLLLVANFLTASKAGLFSFLILIIFPLIGKLKRRKSRKGFLYFVGAVFLITIFLFSDNSTTRRIQTAVGTMEQNIFSSNTLNESTSIRLSLWSLSYDVVKQAPWLGYGTGSVGLALNEACIKYFSFGVCESLRNKNSHNQFLNFMVSNGLPFALLFTIALFLGLYSAFKKRDVIAQLFLCFLMINFVFESLLQRERGVVFFMFFVVVFLISNPVNLAIKGFDERES